MGLLGDGFDDPRSSAIMALAGGLLRGDMGGGLLGANNAYSESKQAALKQKFMDMQMQNYASEIEQRKAKTMQEQAAMEQAQRLQAGIPGLFKQAGMTGGAPAPQTMGDMPMFSKPMGVTPMQSTPGGFDVQAAIKLGLKPEEIQHYAALANIGKQKVARTMKGIGPDGREFEYQVDEFGQRVGDGLPQYRAPISVNRGNSNDFLDPYTLQPKASLKTFQSPDSAASNAVTMRGQNMLDARSKATAEMGTIPSGYRRSMAGGLEFIPGGPADPAAAKKAAPTEFQGKSTTFAARMQDAAKVLDDLEGKVSPAAVAQAGYKPEFPTWMPGGQAISAGLSGANKLVTNEDAQRYHQAQENWVTANLRQESGAAIGKDEMAKDIAKWFPQPGEPDSVKAQKAAARKVAERAMIVQAGPGATSIPGIVGGTEAPSTSGGASPDWRFVNGKLVKVK